MRNKRDIRLTSRPGRAAVLAFHLCLSLASGRAVAQASRPAEAAPSPSASPAQPIAPAPAGPSAVVNENHPIVVAGVGLIGGSKDRAWLKLQSAPKTFKGKPIDPNYIGGPIVVDMPMVRGGETYRLYTPKGVVGSGTGSKVAFQVDGAGNEFHRVKIKPAAKGTPKWLFAINGDWDAIPRPLKTTKKGYAIDVDGDGREETIRVRTTQEKLANAGASGQGESAAEAQSQNNTKVVTFTLEMNGKSSRLMQLTVDGTYTEQYQVAAIDLNGDGWLEFVFTTGGHNDSLEVVDVARGKPETVLSTYSGD